MKIGIREYSEELFMKTDIREYGEELDVEIEFNQEKNRWEITAYNQSGFDCTMVDLMDIVDWYSANRQVVDRVVKDTQKNLSIN